VRSADLRTSARRVAFVRAALLLAFVALAARAAHLSVFDGRGAQRGEAQTLRTLTLAPERGRIVDRRGVGLALSVEAPSVYAVGRDVEDPVEAARLLARAVGVDRAELLRDLRVRDGFRFVARWVTSEQAERVEAAGLRGVGIVREPRRVYPHRSLAARTLGFANIDGRGVRGIEQQEDAWLRGTTRRLPVERDGGGRLLVVSGGTTWGTAGGDVAVTLDAALQAEAERALAEAVRRTGARGGSVLSLDPHTGDILTLAEAPSFDPNRFRETPYRDTRSTAFLDAVEPGSALKPFLVAAALEHGTLAPDDVIDTEEGTLRVPGKTIRDHRDYGPLDPAGVLRVSSNVGAVKVAQELGRDAHFEALRAFGFGDSTASGFPDESAGVLRGWRDWQPVDHATIAFGQGISVTPVQLAAATAALANGGLWVRPRLVSARRAPGGPWQPTRPEVVRRIVSRESARRVVSMLETVVGEDGTGSRAALAGFRVAGKTGTAQKWDAEAGTYSHDRFRAWFIGIAPADAPRLVIVAQLDEPRRPHHTGGAAAAPLFASVAAAQLAHLGIHAEPARTRTARAQRPAEPTAPAPEPETPEPTPVAVAAHGATGTGAAPEPSPPPAAPAVAAPPPPRPAPALELSAYGDRVLLPDFSGLTVDEVMQVTAGTGLRVTLRGSGRAVRQDPPPGSVVASGSEVVRIEFSPSVGHGEGARSAAPGSRG